MSAIRIGKWVIQNDELFHEEIMASNGRFLINFYYADFGKPIIPVIRITDTLNSFIPADNMTEQDVFWALAQESEAVDVLKSQILVLSEELRSHQIEELRYKMTVEAVRTGTIPPVRSDYFDFQY